MNNALPHIPVMLSEVLDALCVENGKTYVDATFGNGGYTSAILEKADCKVTAIDRDPSVQKRAAEIKNKFGSRFEFKQGVFSDLKNLITEPADGIVFDIGVSSMQLDQAERGFSFLKEAKLDMRMSQSGISAYDVVNTMSENELADILYQFGEERKSRQIANKIIQYRQEKPIETTTELAEIVYGVLGKKTKSADPATRTFQALRIYINNELDELKQGLLAASQLLKPEGRLVVVDFHSLEDRIVKTFFKENAPKKVHVSRYRADDTQFKNTQIFSFISDVIIPTPSEILSNPRAHSAKLRYAVKNKGDTHD